jgi:hypothetical protein
MGWSVGDAAFSELLEDTPSFSYYHGAGSLEKRTFQALHRRSRANSSRIAWVLRLLEAPFRQRSDGGAALRKHSVTVGASGPAGAARRPASPALHEIS